MKEKLTLIIPSRNRHRYLDRILEYYQQNDSLSIIICDSSQKQYSKQAELPSHIIYTHHPGSDFIGKIHKVSLGISTPYILLCADDDFITLDGIRSMLDFLESNTGYSSAQGNSVSFYYDRDKIFFAPLYEQITGLDINGSTAKARISDFFNNSIQLFYSVHRSDIFKEIFSAASGKIKSLNLLESFIGVRSIIAGKHKVLPVFYGVREILYDSAGRLVGINVLSTDEQYKGEYNAFLLEMSKQMASKENYGIEEAQLFLEEIIRMHINRRYSQKLLKSQSRLKRVKKWIPFFVRKYLRYRLLLQNEKRQKQYNIDFAREHKGFPFNDAVCLNELARIEAIIKKHNIV